MVQAVSPKAARPTARRRRHHRIRPCCPYYLTHPAHTAAVVTTNHNTADTAPLHSTPIQHTKRATGIITHPVEEEQAAAAVGQVLRRVRPYPSHTHTRIHIHTHIPTLLSQDAGIRGAVLLTV